VDLPPPPPANNRDKLVYKDQDFLLMKYTRLKLAVFYTRVVYLKRKRLFFINLKPPAAFKVLKSSINIRLYYSIV
jgi:hypothetical protein